VFWKFGKHETQDGEEIIEKKSVLCRYYTAFNVEQCEGLPVHQPEPVTEPQIDPIHSCETVVDEWETKPVIQHGGDRASYSKMEDRVAMPFRNSFESSEEYYCTLFHELVHSTGHPKRLNRPTLIHHEHFGDENYSREELVAEMGSAFLCGYTGIGNRTITNSAAYLANWLQALKSDSRLVVVAASQAQKAADMILGVPMPAEAVKGTGLHLAQ
jgi:antirestriction protein ArdC